MLDANSVGAPSRVIPATYARGSCHHDLSDRPCMPHGLSTRKSPHPLFMQAVRCVPFMVHLQSVPVAACPVHRKVSHQGQSGAKRLQPSGGKLAAWHQSMNPIMTPAPQVSCGDAHNANGPVTAWWLHACRFEIDEGQPVLYVYEVQVARAAQQRRADAGRRQAGVERLCAVWLHGQQQRSARGP